MKTTMFVKNKKLTFQICLLLQTTYAYYDRDDKNDLFRIRLEKTFRYHFYNVTKLDDVLIWKISEGHKRFKPEDYSKGFVEFQTCETYLIFTRNWRLHFTLYYWVGTETTLKKKKRVAKYAAIFFVLLSNYRRLTHSTVVLAREDEIFESESFIHIVNQLRSTPLLEDGRHEMLRDINFPLNGANLYLVRNVASKPIIKVPIGLGPQLITPNTCLIVETPHYIEQLYPADVFCGIRAKDRTVMKALRIFRRIYQNISDLQRWRSENSIFQRKGKFKVLLELLENIYYYRPSETGYYKVENALVRIHDRGIMLFKSSLGQVNGIQTMIRQEIEERPLTSGSMDIGANYILDSESVAGIFFAFTTNFEMNIYEIIGAIQDAEEYLFYKTISLGIPIRMRIASSNPSLHFIDFAINFSI